MPSKSPCCAIKDYSLQQLQEQLSYRCNTNNMLTENTFLLAHLQGAHRTDR